MAILDDCLLTIMRGTTWICAVAAQTKPIMIEIDNNSVLPRMYLAPYIV